MAGPWLRDSEGNDVFDQVNDPLSGDPIFDRVDVSRSVSNTPFDALTGAGETVDQTDERLRDIVRTNPIGGAARNLPDVLKSAEDLGKRDPYNPDSPNSLPFQKIMYALIIGGTLYLLAPVLNLLTVILGNE
jgi:hypothetical protein